jgi:hypothetical protein
MAEINKPTPSLKRRVGYEGPNKKARLLMEAMEGVEK